MAMGRSFHFSINREKSEIISLFPLSFSGSFFFLSLFSLGRYLRYQRFSTDPTRPGFSGELWRSLAVKLG
ncbi:hypothetical protein RchiOBHm_Chr2g0123541 [Rosa chinensis]|uniref:Uncharacterized protein n=1 Tax=Rosa chinensis TaxID=74649 RepID=A0A2P6RT22_ROSCH|nr:hypothetical protein RchiOBHm_Chr2g0123541 [Rosa chinensis]